MARDFERIKRERWHAHKNRKTFYAVALINGKNVYMHRFLTNNQYDVVDHIDGNGLFNITANFRNGINGINQRNEKDAVGACYIEGKDCYMGKFYEYNGQQKAKLFYIRDYLSNEDAKSAASEWARSNNQRVLERIEQDGRCPEEQKHVCVKKSSNSGHKHILHRKDSNAYLVQICRNGTPTRRTFSYATRSQESALAAAIEFRDTFLAENPPMQLGRKKKQKTE